MHLRRRRKELSEIFLNKTQQNSTQKDYSTGFGSKLWTFGRRGGANPSKLPPAYAHELLATDSLNQIATSTYHRENIEFEI